MESAFGSIQQLRQRRRGLRCSVSPSRQGPEGSGDGTGPLAPRIEASRPGNRRHPAIPHPRRGASRPTPACGCFSRSSLAKRSWLACSAVVVRAPCNVLASATRRVWPTSYEAHPQSRGSDHHAAPAIRLQRDLRRRPCPKPSTFTRPLSSDRLRGCAVRNAHHPSAGRLRHPAAIDRDFDRLPKPCSGMEPPMDRKRC